MRLVRLGEQHTLSGHSAQSGESTIIINTGISQEIFTKIKDLKDSVFMCINVCLQIAVPGVTFVPGAQGSQKRVFESLGTQVIVGCKPPR